MTVLESQKLCNWHGLSHAGGESWTAPPASGGRGKAAIIPHFFAETCSQAPVARKPPASSSSNVSTASSTRSSVTSAQFATGAAPSLQGCGSGRGQQFQHAVDNYRKAPAIPRSQTPTASASGKDSNWKLLTPCPTDEDLRCSSWDPERWLMEGSDSANCPARIRRTARREPTDVPGPKGDSRGTERPKMSGKTDWLCAARRECESLDEFTGELLLPCPNSNTELVEVASDGDVNV